MKYCTEAEGMQFSSVFGQAHHLLIAYRIAVVQIQLLQLTQILGYEPNAFLAYRTPLHR